MEKIERFGVLSFAKLRAVTGALIGLVCGILYSCGGLIMDALVTIGWMTSAETPGLSYGTILAFGALIGMPIILAAFGFLLGLVEAVLYNIFAKRFGGLRIEFEQKEKHK